MRSQKGFTLLELLIVVIICLMGIGYVMNIVKLVSCDFKAPYKAEFIHTVGLIPIVGWVTGWLNIPDGGK